MNIEEIQKRLAEANPERVEAYHKMFDRILLYILACKILDRDQINQTVSFVDKVIKKTIDMDSQERNHLLYGTKQGRANCMLKEQDGEALRLDCLKNWELVKDLVVANLTNNSE